MDLPASPRPNFLAGSTLDRAAHLRDDEAWIAARRADPASLVTPLWRAQSLVRETAPGRPVAALLPPGQVPMRDALGVELPWAFLGLAGERAVFTVDLSRIEAPMEALHRPDSQFAELRGVAANLPGHEASMLAHARGLMHWRSRHLFCGVCGAPCVPDHAGNRMRCTACDTEHFPRTDPAVIMLVVRGDRALLGNAVRFPHPNFYSTLAGFVEPGESLEEAVAREVFEEVGVRVGAVRYHSSQPWPFPASLMLGFHAEGLTEDIRPDAHELRDARWFTRAELRDRAARGIDLPGSISIARRLIEDWMELE